FPQILRAAQHDVQLTLKPPASRSPRRRRTVTRQKQNPGSLNRGFRCACSPSVVEGSAKARADGVTPLPERLGLLQRGLDAVLRDVADAGSGDAQRDPALLRRHPEALLLDVHLEPLAGVVHGMRNLHARLALLSGDFTRTAHDDLEC